MTDAEKLADARTQLHLLVTGQAAKVYVDQNGERVEYNHASIPVLKQYISGLEAALAGRPVHSGAARIFF